MDRRISWFALAVSLIASIPTPCAAQQYTTPAPDGSPSASFHQGCVTSHFFNFAYLLPEQMTLDDMSSAPNGGVDPTHKNTVIFMAYRPRGINRDVVDAAAEDRNSTQDSSAASWMRALHRQNAARPDVPNQEEVESITVGNQQFSRLHFLQSRNDGVITYETAYAVGVRGYVVYFIFGSIDPSQLVLMEKSIESFSSEGDPCSLKK